MQIYNTIDNKQHVFTLALWATPRRRLLLRRPVAKSGLYCTSLYCFGAYIQQRIKNEPERKQTRVCVYVRTRIHVVKYTHLNMCVVYTVICAHSFTFTQTTLQTATYIWFIILYIGTAGITFTWGLHLWSFFVQPFMYNYRP